MIPVEYINLINKIKEVTSKRMVRWNKTSDSNRFDLEIESNSISINRYDNPLEFPKITIDILDIMGEYVDGFYIYSDDQDYKMLSDLYSDIRRNALRINETIDELNSGLDSILHKSSNPSL